MNDTTTKFTISPAVMKGLGLTADTLPQLNEYRYSILRVERELPTRNGSAAMTLSTAVALQADGGVEVVDMAASLAVDEKRIFLFPQPASIPAEQQFLLEYRALCAQHGVHFGHTYGRVDQELLYEGSAPAEYSIELLALLNLPPMGWSRSTREWALPALAASGSDLVEAHALTLAQNLYPSELADYPQLIEDLLPALNNYLGLEDLPEPWHEPVAKNQAEWAAQNW